MKLNYGLAGFGGIAKIHLLGIKNIHLLGVPIDFEVNLSTLFTTSQTHRMEGITIGFENTVDSIDTLARSNVDLVDICTPNFLHKEEILLASNAGKHIYCEKPLGMNSIETSEIMKDISKSGVKNQVAFMLRFLPAVAYAHAILKQNLLGRIYAFRGEFFHSSYLNPDKKMSWRQDKNKSGGGALMDLGVHLIDLVRFLIGEIEAVSASIETIVKKRHSVDGKLEDVSVDDWALLSMNLQSGTKGTLEASRVAAGNEGTRLTIYGEHGSLRIDLSNPYLPAIFDVNSKNFSEELSFLSDDDFYSEVLRLYPIPKFSQGFMIDAHLTALLWFFKSIVADKVLSGTPTFEDGHKAQEVIDAAYQSAREKGALKNLNI